METIQYTRHEDRLNALTHALGVGMALTAGIILLIKARTYPNSNAIIGVIVYTLGMLSSYLASTFYHAAQSPRLRYALRKIDHAAIYFHIAGTYTAMILLTIWYKGAWGVAILSFIWLASVIGGFSTFRKMKQHNYFETICYVLLGASILVAFRPLWDFLSDANNLRVFWWMIAGGVAYVTGAVFYSFHKSAYMHTVFHVFVLMGSLCHITAVGLAI